ncbi:MAG: TPM domain-containing protein [Candidatus Sumerlaeaceae bacterium]
MLSAITATALDVPPFNPEHKEVTDLTGTLKPAEVSALVSKIQAVQASDGTQISVLLIPTLDGDEIFDFTQRVATTWKIGQSKIDNGVLFLIVKNDKKARIHVGYGLEGRLTDALSKRILLNEVQPEFRSGRFYQGIDRAVTAIIQAVKGEYTAPAKKSTGKSSDAGFWVMLAILAFLWMSGMRMSRRGSRRRRRAYGGFYFPTLGSGGGGGWSSGGGGGWSSGGGGGGFGGGDFGGGGASGDW